MWTVILQFLRLNSRYIALPFAVVVGCVGLNIEKLLRNQEDISSVKHAPKQTVADARLKRQIDLELSPSSDLAPPQDAPPPWNELMFDRNKR
ncbi:hypothetical protein T265_07124 [Opisthorchis viverrini]|uniref:Small integral membrane protein 12 n=2 Tax=Opisthorchis viverrini TaxID=6198 RepID=A0A074ZE44_OPIVI|nr:hypothetical protein T265_07124 [Opisthorchis viverrini]KER25443.1 hypothetical protein T265_07124 [Opisthorchis viverrini]